MTRAAQLNLKTPHYKTQTELSWSRCTAHIKVQNVAKAGVSHKHHCVPIHAPEVPDGQACIRRLLSTAEGQYRRGQKHVLRLLGTSNVPVATRLPSRPAAAHTVWKASQVQATWQATASIFWRSAAAGQDTPLHEMLRADQMRKRHAFISKQRAGCPGLAAPRQETLQRVQSLGLYLLNAREECISS